MSLPVRRLVLVALALAVAAFASFACDNSDDETITVFAAASLTDAFTEIGAAFEDANPGISVEFNFASSSALAVQVNEGAPADVFASANNTQMVVVVDGGNASGPQRFATNRLAVVVPADSTKVASFEDLAEPGVLLILAAPEVPVGNFARESLAKASALHEFGDDFSVRVLENLVSNETDVRAVLTKIQLGEADAGIVYTTDAAVASDEVAVIEIPVEANVLAEYPIVALNDAGNASAAEAFVAFVLSSEGLAILERHGFGAP